MLTQEQQEFLERVRESQNDTKWRCRFQPENTYSNPNGVDNPLDPSNPISFEEFLRDSLRPHP